jgi:predicted DNA-binding transcriptional regulator AlpA
MTRSTGLSRWERKRVGRTRRGVDPTVESPLLSIPELCAFTKLARSVIYERLEEFAWVRLGKRRFATKESAVAFLARHTQPARVSRRRADERDAANT